MSANDNDAASELLIREVDEDLRNEYYQRLWRRYGHFVIGGAIAVVLGVAGGEFWMNWQAQQRDAASQKLAEAERLIAADKLDDSYKLLSEIEHGHQSGFALLAGMRHAALLAQANDIAGAVAEYDSIAASSAPQLYRDLAVIKEALLTLDTGDVDALQKRVAPLAEVSNVWHYTATEILALLARRKGDIAAATTYYKTLADDLAAPPTIRARAGEMLTIIAPTAPTVDQTKG